MISFRSEVFPEKNGKKIKYTSNSFFVGSCFAENVGQELIKRKFRTLINPFGVLYNPYSVKNCLVQIMDNVEYSEEMLFFYNEKWLSFSHHGKLSNPDLGLVLDKINKQIITASSFLKNTNVLFITFGTAWVYRWKKTGEVVANCHKLPSSEFIHELLDVEEIYSAYEHLLTKLKEFNPDIEIVFTISPVRHWKDGAVNNQRSKSTLFVAIHSLIDKYDYVSYFPSYEIMMDDLRDYRFYAGDLMHPNDLAVDYIWEKFKEAYIDGNTQKLVSDIEQLNKNVNHKVFYPQTQAYLKFLESNMKLIAKIEKLNPDLDLDLEKFYFFDQCKTYFPEVFKS